MANKQIGTCPCPVKDCAETMAVRRFVTKAGSDERRRKGGKLYADCPSDGRFGFDGAQKMQDYLLENSTLWDEEEIDAEAARQADQARRSQVQLAPPTKVTPAAAKPAPASNPKPPPPATPKRGLLDF
jgi:hypothetical protein